MGVVVLSNNPNLEENLSSVNQIPADLQPAAIDQVNLNAVVDLNADQYDESCKSDMLSKSYRFVKRKNSILFCSVNKQDFLVNSELLKLKKMVEDTRFYEDMHVGIRARVKSEKFPKSSNWRRSSLKKIDFDSIKLGIELNPQQNFTIRAIKMSQISDEESPQFSSNKKGSDHLNKKLKINNQESLNDGMGNLQEHDLVVKKSGIRQRTMTMQAPFRKKTLEKKGNEEDDEEEEEFYQDSNVRVQQMEFLLSEDDHHKSEDGLKKPNAKELVFSPTSINQIAAKSRVKFKLSPDSIKQPSSYEIEKAEENFSALGVSLLSEDYKKRVRKLETLIDTDKTLAKVKMCIICQEKIPDCVLDSCGHGGICYDCYETLLKHNSRCPFCRVVIKSYLKK